MPVIEFCVLARTVRVNILWQLKSSEVTRINKKTIHSGEKNFSQIKYALVKL